MTEIGRPMRVGAAMVSRGHAFPFSGMPGAVRRDNPLSYDLVKSGMSISIRMSLRPVVLADFCIADAMPCSAMPCTRTCWTVSIW